MIIEMDLEEACDIIYRFADANQLDALAGIEAMVKYFSQLSGREKAALTVFMDKTRG